MQTELKQQNPTVILTLTNNEAMLVASMIGNSCQRDREARAIDICGIDESKAAGVARAVGDIYHELDGKLIADNE